MVWLAMFNSGITKRYPIPTAQATFFSLFNDRAMTPCAYFDILHSSLSNRVITKHRPNPTAQAKIFLPARCLFRKSAAAAETACFGRFQPVDSMKLRGEFPMTSGGSITKYLQSLHTGDDAAAQALWERYFMRLVELARSKLKGAARRVANEEDVALSVFDSFCRGMEEGRFPNLNGRDDLWRVLVVLTARKALRQVQREQRQKRGGGNVVTEADLPPGSAEEGTALDRVIGREPDPAFAAQVAEECGHLFHILGDEELRGIARWKMEGYTNGEIAGKLGCLERTVERKLRVIRSLWEEHHSRQDKQR
jgi:DNA-directed RNA polymerase specialized sigma24 family protein